MQITRISPVGRLGRSAAGVIIYGPRNANLRAMGQSVTWSGRVTDSNRVFAKVRLNNRFDRFDSVKVRGSKHRNNEGPS